MKTCDAEFQFDAYTGNEERVPIHCGVTYDYCVEEGQSAHLVFARIRDWDVLALLDEGLREEIEHFACFNSYEIQQRMTHNSMRNEDEHTR